MDEKMHALVNWHTLIHRTFLTQTVGGQRFSAVLACPEGGPCRVQTHCVAAITARLPGTAGKIPGLGLVACGLLLLFRYKQYIQSSGEHARP